MNLKEDILDWLSTIVGTGTNYRERKEHIRFMRSKTEATAIEYNGVLKENEIVRMEDTGKFKIGDGMSKFSELPYTSTLPDTVIVYW